MEALKYARNVINNYDYSLAKDYSDLCDIYKCPRALLRRI